MAVYENGRPLALDRDECLSPPVPARQPASEEKKARVRRNRALWKSLDRIHNRAIYRRRNKRTGDLA